VAIKQIPLLDFNKHLSAKSLSAAAAITLVPNINAATS